MTSAFRLDAPPIDAAPSAARRYVVGADLGGTKIDLALADLDGVIVANRVAPTDRRGGRHVCAEIGALVDAIARDAGIDRDAIAALAIGSPGAVDVATGRVELAPNIPDFDTFDVVGAIRAATGLPVRFENDVLAAAIGEQAAGHGQGVADFAFVSLGTGIGMGLVCGGKLLAGARGAAGEIAYLPLGEPAAHPDSVRCGSLELQIGAAGIIRRYEREGGAEGLTVKAMFDRIADGDAAALRTVEALGEKVALTALTVACIVDPGLIVLGGSIGVRPELVGVVERHLARCAPRPILLKPSALGARAGVFGAIALALQEVAVRDAA